MLAIMVKEFRELRRDKRTLAMLIALPLLFLVIFGYAANFTVDKLTVTILGADSSQIADQIRANPDAVDHLDIVTVDTNGTGQDARDALRDDKSDVAILAAGLASGSPLRVYIDGSNLFAAQAARVVFAQLAGAQAAEAAQASQGSQTAHPAPSVKTTVLFNPDLKTSWVMIPAIIGLILTFIGTIITSIGLVRERESGTLEQLAVMPFSPSAVILGKIAPYYLLGALDMAVVTLLGIWIFGVPFNGDWTIFVVGAALFLFVVLGIGVLISSVSRTTGQAIQLALMTLLPQILLSGMIFPLEAMAVGVRWIGYLLPLTWFTKVSQGVMLRGASWDTLWLPLAILAFMAVVVFGAAVLRLRRSITPAKPHRQRVHAHARVAA